MPDVTRRCPGWMATSPLKRSPSTKTGQRRRAPPAANSTTPIQQFAADGPEVDAVGVGRQKHVEHADHAKGHQHPAVGAIFLLAGTEIPPLNRAAGNSAIVRRAIAVRAGFEKNVATPPPPTIASPRLTSVAAMANSASLGLNVTAVSTSEALKLPEGAVNGEFPVREKWRPAVAVAIQIGPAP